MNRKLRDRYSSIPKRNFRNSLIKLFEDEYKILGSRKILELLADDIENLHKEFYPDKTGVGFGEIVFRTTADDGQRQSYGKRTEDYSSVTVILPLITESDIERRIYYIQGGIEILTIGIWNRRDIETMVRLVKE